MRFALSIAVNVSDHIGCFGVLTHPADDAVRSFYHQFCFETLPFDPLRAMIVPIKELRLNGF